MTGSPDKWYGVSDVSTRAVIAAAGCYAQLAPDVFVQMGDVDVIVGIQNRSHIVEYVEEAAAEKQKQEEAAASNTSGSSGNTDSGSSGGNTTITVPDTPAETTDLVLFAAILQCEAGGYNYDGILAVATVIMNRMESPAYPNTISGVVYQSGQFAPTWDGSLSRVLQSGPVSLCYQSLRSSRRRTARIRKRMLPVPKRKYRCVRDQRWGKCIF